MLKYSPEEYQSLNLSEKDSDHMKALNDEAEKILNTENKKAKELLIIANQERLLREAKRILYRIRDKQNDIVGEAKYLANENVPFEPILLKEQLDQTSEYYSNVWKGSWSEKFYELIIEEVPDIGISIVDKKEFPDKVINENCVAIKATPYKTDRRFLCDLELNPVIDFLTNPWFSESLGKELEDEEIFQPGTTERVLKSAYQENIIELKKYLANHGSDPKVEKDIKDYEKKLDELGNVIPFSDEEAEELMRGVIKEKYREKLFKNEEEELTS